MAPSKRFKPVKRVAESRERSAAREFGDSQRRAREQEAKLADLNRYHKEYIERFERTAAAGMSATQLQEYRAFLAKLELAIREQEKVVRSSQSECVARKDEWQQKHVRTQALDKAIDRMKSAERKASDSREQKELDERNQRGGGSSN